LKNSDKPCVSIIVPVYNAESFLRRCLDSLIAQTLSDIEIVLVDDGSTDNSLSICRAYAKRDERIKIISQQNTGISGARNAGLDAACGEYIGFADSDDHADADMFFEMYTAAKRHDADIVNCDILECGRLIKTNAEKNRVIDLQAERDCIFSHINTSKIAMFAVRNITRARIIKDNKIYFPPDARGQESPFFMECFLNAKSYYSLDRALYFYMPNPGSLSRVKFNPGLLRQLTNQYNRKIEVYNKYGINRYLPDLYDYLLNHTLILLISNVLCAPENKARKQMLKEIRDSDMISAAFRRGRMNKIASFKLDVLRRLLKYRQYWVIGLLLAFKPPPHP